MTQERGTHFGSINGTVYHPLLNVALPGTAELRSRCDDSDSIEVLDAACRFAELRIRNLNHVRDALLEYSNGPYNGTSIQVEAAQEPELTETDILRALLALQKTYLAAALFDPTFIRIHPSESFHRMAEHWRTALGALEPCHQATPQLSITLGWARRWALMFLENPTMQIGVSTWVRSVMHAFPAELNNVFVDGLFTVDESRAFMSNAFEQHLKQQVAPAPPDFPNCPAAYFDRHGLLDAANKLLTNSNGIFLVGNDEGPLRNLVRAISSDVNYCPEHKALEDIRGGGGHRLSAGGFGILGVSDSKAVVLALTGNTPEQSGGQAWCLDPSSLTYEDQASESLAFFRWLTGTEARENVRYVIAMNRDEWTTLVKEVPEIARIPKIDVPAVQDLDLIPSFLMSLPAVLERHNCAVPLGLLLDLLYQTSISNASRLAISDASDLIDFVVPERTDFGLLNPLPFNGLDKTPFASLSRQSFPIKLRLRKANSIAAEAEAFFSKYIDDASGLESLIMLHETVTLLSDAEPSERVVGSAAGSGIASGRPATPAIERGSADSSSSLQPTSTSPSYLRTASALPLPTAAQTARFASFVAEAHSWYKHLPLHPMTPFFFFLDPVAGVERGELKAISPVETNVDTYRERFGYWNYHVDRDRALLKSLDRLQRGSLPVERDESASKVQNTDGKALVIPSGLMLDGMAKLSAFVHKDLWVGMASSHSSQNPFTFGVTLDQAPKALSDELRAVWSCLQTPNWYPPFASDFFARHDSYLAALAADPGSPTRWRDVSAVTKMARELGGDHLYEQVLFAVEMRQTMTSRKSDVEIHRGSSPDDAVRDLVDCLVYERMRQIQSMKDAMHRFIGGLS